VADITSGYPAGFVGICILAPAIRRSGRHLQRLLGRHFQRTEQEKPRESGELHAGPIFDRISNNNVSGESLSRVIGIASPELLRWSHWRPSFPNDECTMRFS
jgi:hypothetical protein